MNANYKPNNTLSFHTRPRQELPLHPGEVIRILGDADLLRRRPLPEASNEDTFARVRNNKLYDNRYEVQIQQTETSRKF